MLKQSRELLILIFSAMTNRFNSVDFDALKGRQVEVTGKVTEYRERAQIIVEIPGNLKVAEPNAKAKE